MDSKNNTGNTKLNSAIDNEESTFSKFSAEVKSSIFKMFFVLLKEQEVSLYFSLLLAFVHAIQVIGICFDSTIAGVWVETEITKVLTEIFSYFTIVQYLKATNWNLYIAFFYIFVFITNLTVAAAFYVSVAYNSKKTTSSWPMTTLRIVLTLYVSILANPLYQYFVSMLACVKNEQGVVVHSYFTEVQCWQGIYYLHGIMAILTAINYAIILLVTASIFFEYRGTLNDPTSRVTSRPLFSLIVYQLVMAKALVFLTDSQFQIIVLILIFVGSAWVFSKYYYQSKYHDDMTGKFWACIASANFWTATMIVFAKLMEDTLFDGSVITWLVGMPFVIMIIVTARDHRTDLLLINVNKFQSGEEIQNQMRFVQRLIKSRLVNRNASILLDGYMEMHKQSCNRDDCPLRQKGINKSRYTQSLMEYDETLNEKYAVLLQLLYVMYSDGIKKFPYDVDLRISFAFFLLERMHSKQQALQELNQAEQFRPGFDQQFIIYRYKRIIEAEIAESQREGHEGLDVVSETAFQNQLRQMQANIEKSALLHMEFWSQLSEDNPDLSKLSDIGWKINSSVQYVEDNWVKLIKINPNNAKSMRLYGKYLIEIINDKDLGDSLLEKARTLTSIQSNKKAMNMLGGTNEDYTYDSTPAIWLSGEQDKFGIITGINLSAATLFGYNKAEVVNRKVNMLMPQIYSKHHDTILETYISSGQSIIVGKNKEHSVFGKNKSNYVFPIGISIKAITTIVQGIQFIATVRVEKNFKNSAYILTNPEGGIDGVSTTCINVLKLDNTSINLKKANIQDFVPNIIKDHKTIFNTVNSNGKAVAQVKFNFPKDSEHLDDNESASANLNCHFKEIHFLNGRFHGGYMFKFERITEKLTGLSKFDRKAKLTNFQFRYERGKPVVFGEYFEGTVNEMQMAQGDFNDDLLSALEKTEVNYESGAEGGTRPNNSPARSKGSEDDVTEVKRIDYGAGIKTLRLFMGKPQDIDDNRSDDNEEDGDDNNPNRNSNQSASQQQQQQQKDQEEDTQDEGSLRDFSTTFKSKKALTSIVNDRALPSTIKNLKLVANILVTIIIVIAIIDYVLTVNEFNAIESDLELLDKSNQQTTSFMEVLSKVRDLNLLRQGLMTTSSNENGLRNDLEAALNNAKAINEYLEQQTADLSSDHLNLLNNAVIPLKDINGVVTMKSLTQSTENLISRGFTILGNPLSMIAENNTDYYFVTYNLLNNYYSGLVTSTYYYGSELSQTISEKNTAFLLILIASIVSIVLATLTSVPIFYQVSRAREEVLSLFLDIPERTVKGLYSKCETFISNLQVGDDDEIMSEIDDADYEKANDENDHSEFIVRKKRKRFKNSGRGQKSLQMNFLFIVLVFEAYFIYNYASSRVLLGNINTVMVEYNATSFAEGYYSFVNNAERQLFMDSTFPVLNSKSQVISTNNIESIYDLDSQMLQEHSVNRKMESDTYTNVFNQIMMMDPCPTFLASYGLTQSTCENFADLTVSQGMTVALTRHFENLRALLSCYNILAAGGTSCTIDLPSGVSVPGKTSTQNQELSLMLTPQALEIDTMQYTYIHDTFTTLTTNFKAGLNDEFNSAITQRLIVFIIFLVVLVVIYIVLWLPLVRKVSNDIWRTKSMLSMIPLHVIAKIRSIRIYLKKFWNERNIAEY